MQDETGAEIRPSEQLETSSSFIELKPQRPEIPWEQWYAQTRSRLTHWNYIEPVEEIEPVEQVAPLEPMDSDEEFFSPFKPIVKPNLPKEYEAIKFEFPSLEQFESIDRLNPLFRSILGGNSDKVFYRPGLGYGGVIEEILEKIGTFQTMIISDPVYAEQEMVSLSNGLLPINYFLKSIQILEPEKTQVLLSDTLDAAGKTILPENYESTEIPKGGKATIKFNLNGVDLSIELLTEDMTKYSPGNFDLISLGQPTPYVDGSLDPRLDKGFQASAIDRLNPNGLLQYEAYNFRFIPKFFPAEILGFELIFKDRNIIIAQKKEDKSSTAESLYEAEALVEEAAKTLSARIKVPSLGAVYYKNAFQYDDNPRDGTIEDIYTNYEEHLEKISKFVNTISSPQLRSQAIKRLEFYLLGPIATNGQLDEEKLTVLEDVPLDPDDPDYISPHASFNEPYFGNVRALVMERDKGLIDAIEYYQGLIDRFYKFFPAESDDKKELPQAETLNQKLTSVKSDVEGYISAVESFRESPDGKEIAKRSLQLEYLQSYIDRSPFDRDLESWIQHEKALSEFDNRPPKPDEEIREEVIQRRTEREVEAKKSIEQLTGKPFENIDEAAALSFLKKFLEEKGIRISTDNKYKKVQLFLGNYPIRIIYLYEPLKNEAIIMNLINDKDNEFNYLDTAYQSILENLFSKLPENMLFVYPAIGGDKTFYDVATKSGHQVIGIDPYQDLNIPPNALLKKEFHSYHETINELENQIKIPPPEKRVLVFKGFDNISKVSQDEINQIITDFDGEYILIFGSGSNAMFAYGPPDLDQSKALVNLKGNDQFQDSTKEFFSPEEIKLMDDITQTSRQLEWTTGVFPGTTVRVFRKLPQKTS